MDEPIDYSRHGEQAVIMRNTPPSGYLLDVGAYHPTQFSNTRALLDAGWSGTLVDVSPASVRHLVSGYNGHPSVRVVQAAVGVGREWLDLWFTDDALTTSSAEVQSIWSKLGGYYGTARVQTVPFIELLDDRPISFLNIDVEGASGRLFLHALAVLADKHLPECICVEHDGDHKRLTDLASGYDYRQVLLNSTNLVVAR